VAAGMVLLKSIFICKYCHCCYNRFIGSLERATGEVNHE
jgi:hypothetical protein